MDAGARLSKAASLIGDPSRAAMLWSLLGGEARPASELAMLANISPQTASNHLRLLTDARFLRVESLWRPAQNAYPLPASASDMSRVSSAFDLK